jgi:outer membrane biogenesis lipoprotein LolB
MKRTLVLAIVVLLAAGCRSDGGIGRSSSANELKWTADRMWDRTERDWEATKDNVAGIGPWISNSFTEGWRQINYTLDLYLENQQSKPGYERYDRGNK